MCVFDLCFGIYGDVRRKFCEVVFFFSFVYGAGIEFRFLDFYRRYRCLESYFIGLVNYLNNNKYIYFYIYIWFRF